MIRLTRSRAPIELTTDYVAEKTQHFVRTKEPVWNVAFIRESLAGISRNKCAYCECLLGEESKYLEVEHFFCKQAWPLRVLDWQNLLPACKRCNISKGSHNVAIEPIIDPTQVDPRDHFTLHAYRLRGRTPAARNTLEVTDLNNAARVVKKRFEVCELGLAAIGDLEAYLSNYEALPTTGRRNKVLGKAYSVLEMCQSGSQYSATCATVILIDPAFLESVEHMKRLSIWTEALEGMFRGAEELHFN